jgi:16S rRNA (cytidine1402-2'-O)-methyltransferase
MSTLYIVATPIGNLEDISMRALRILGEVDFILCEDTRVTGKLLAHYKINTPTISYHQHSDEKKNEQVLALLTENKDLALVTDAGTPGISDPGGKLVQAVINKFGNEVRVESVPGPSAVTAALSISGIPTDKFVFMGFPPNKKGRQTFLKLVIASEFPVVLYESKYRIIKLLEELDKMNREIIKKAENQNDEQIKNFPTFGDKQFPISNKISKFKYQKEKAEKKEQLIPVTSVVVCRELSKMHETVYRGELKNIIEKIKQSQNDQKGEFVVIIGK